MEGDGSLDVTEARYRLLLEQSPVGQAIYDLRGRLVEVNAAWLDLLRHTGDDVLGRRAIDFVHPDDHDALRASVDDLVAARIPAISGERRLLGSDGTVRWVSSTITIRRAADGTPIEFHSLVTDISSLKEATEALERSEARARAVVEALSEGVLIHTATGALEFASRSALDILDTTLDDLRRATAASFLTTDEHGRLLGADDLPAATVLRTGTAAGPMTIGVTLADGSHRWLLVNARPWFRGSDEPDTPDPTPAGAVVSFSDITSRKRSEDDRIESEARYRAVIEALEEGLIIIGHHEVIAANAGAGRLLGIRFGELDGPAGLGALMALDVAHLDGTPASRDEHAAHVALTTGTPVFGVERLVRPRHGEPRRVQINAVPLVVEDEPHPYACVVTLTDVTEQRQAEDALAASEVRFRTLAEELPVAVFLADRRGDLVYSNPMWRELIGRGAGRALADPAESVIHPADRERVQRAMVRATKERTAYHEQYRIRRPGDLEDVRWVSSRGAPLFDDHGEVDGYVGFLEDISPLVAAQEETARLADIVESTSDLVSIIDLRTQRFAYLNRAARRALGLDDDVDPGTLTVADLHTPESAERFLTDAEPRLLSGRGWSGELDMAGPDGAVMQIWQTLTPALGAEGEVRWASSLGRDVTERRRLEAELAHRATHDPLTDLPNRTKLLERLELALTANAEGRYVAVLFLDLDRFKQVNDLYGHEAGDVLLAQVADRIADVVRPQDTVARLGGDEFVILCDDIVDEAHAVAVGTRVTAAIEREPFPLGDVDLSITASVGIALSSGVHAHSEVLLRDADAAMYRAKDQGRARIELFDEAMRRRAAHRIEVTEQLAAALADGGIVVHYQPCVDLRTGRVTAVEALARWEHPERGLLGPKEFIGLAEDSGLIVELGSAVLHTACRDLRRWADACGADAPRVHVNLSTRQILAADLTSMVRRTLHETGVPATSLCLEITESVLMEDTEAAVAVLEELTALGVQLAIDDFGTGYSSLSYLRRFPVDILKIDGSFVEALGPDPEDAAFVGAIVNLAHSLGLEAVAEGVETADQLVRLRLLGCGAAQGFHFAPPLPADEVDGLLTTVFPL